MGILQIPDFWSSLLLMQNIFFYWLILVKSAVDAKYFLLLVDLFTSKIYVYPMKNRSLLGKKLHLFYEDVQNKRTRKLRLQTDLEFKQNQIKKLNAEFNVKMFHTKIRGGKAFAAEQ